MSDPKIDPTSIVHHYYYHNGSKHIIRYFEDGEEWFLDTREILTGNQEAYEPVDYGQICDCNREKASTKTENEDI